MRAVAQGADRAGKSTQCELAVRQLQSRGVSAELWRFPDRTTTLGAAIDAYLKGTKNLSDQAVRAAPRGSSCSRPGCRTRRLHGSARARFTTSAPSRPRVALRRRPCRCTSSSPPTAGRRGAPRGAAPRIRTAARLFAPAIPALACAACRGVLSGSGRRSFALLRRSPPPSFRPAARAGPRGPQRAAGGGARARRDGGLRPLRLLGRRLHRGEGRPRPGPALVQGTRAARRRCPAAPRLCKQHNGA